MYEGAENQGMRCIREILNQYAEAHSIEINYDEFDIRRTAIAPDMSYDAYISTGGPGSPIDSEGTEWENNFFKWISDLSEYNATNSIKKHAFFICHSFQLTCRYFGIAEVSKRKSTSFGVFPVHKINGGYMDDVFANLKEPFYVVDSRDYQVINPNHDRLAQLGCELLAIEKNRPHVPLPRAIMAVRFNDYMVGTQFHPEADAVGMRMYLQREDKKKVVIENHGEPKWHSMMEGLADTTKITYTYNNILPNFLNSALQAQLNLSPVAAV
jgi:homoserine O-succinyltransferase/O-acetyltransferase